MVVPCLEISGDVSFLGDTGADYTALMPMDGEEMQVPFASDEFNQLEDSNAEGIGGRSGCKIVPAHVIILGSDHLYLFDIALRIFEPHKNLQSFPSLMGRDIVSRMKMESDPMRGVLSFIVRDSDGMLPI